MVRIAGLNGSQTMRVLTKYKRKTKPDSLTALQKSCLMTPYGLCLGFSYPLNRHGCVVGGAALGPAVIRGREPPRSRFNWRIQHLVCRRHQVLALKQAYRFRRFGFLVKSDFKGEDMTRTIRILCVALLTMVGLVGSSLQARADERDERHERCERDLHRAEARLRDAVQRYGEESRQAHKRHEQLEEVRRRCGDRRDDHHEEHHDMDQPHQ